MLEMEMCRVHKHMSGGNIECHCTVLPSFDTLQTAASAHTLVDAAYMAWLIEGFGKSKGGSYTRPARGYDLDFHDQAFRQAGKHSSKHQRR